MSASQKDRLVEIMAQPKQSDLMIRKFSNQFIKIDGHVQWE